MFKVFCYFLILVLLLPISGYPQSYTPSQMTYYPGLYFNSGPTTPGQCAAPAWFYNTSGSGTMYTCVSGTWQAEGSSTGSGITACAATPPTTGVANSYCYNTSNATWKCANGASACTLASQWVAVGTTYNPTVTAGTGGVTANLLVGKDTSAPTKYIALVTSGSCGAGIAAASAGAGSTFTLQAVPGAVYTGVAQAAITAGHKVLGGTSIPGDVVDSGYTSASDIDQATCIIGTAQTSATNPGDPVSILFAGIGTYGIKISSGDLPTLTLEQLNWGICYAAGCGSEVSVNLNFVANPNGVTFDECGVSMVTAPTGSSVIIDVQTGAGVSIFGATKLVIPTTYTVPVFQSTFANSPQTATKGATFKAVVTQNDSNGVAQFAYVKCRVH